MKMTENILQVEDLKKHFPTPYGTVRALDGVSFTVRTGETLGLVGESGSGKSTVAYTVVGMYEPTGGTIRFDGKSVEGDIDRRDKILKRHIQIVFQDPGSSLNPRKTVRKILELPLKVHNIGRRNEHFQKAVDLLNLVQLPAQFMYKTPAMLGGGERQMVSIARALATDPRMIILDEPTSALDVSIQAKIINMLLDFQKRWGLSYLFITHDLSLMRNVATRVAIMYLGKLCELAPAVGFFQKPLHPYTRMLLSSIPVVSKQEETLKPKRVLSRGEIPSPVDIPPGCSFCPRCPERMDVCAHRDPEMISGDQGHLVRCHLFSS